MKLSRRQLRKLILKEAEQPLSLTGGRYRTEDDQQRIDSIENGVNNELASMSEGYGFECVILPTPTGAATAIAATLKRWDDVEFHVYGERGQIEISTDIEYDDRLNTKGGSYAAEQLAETILEIIEKKG